MTFIGARSPILFAQPILKAFRSGILSVKTAIRNAVNRSIALSHHGQSFAAEVTLHNAQKAAMREKLRWYANVGRFICKNRTIKWKRVPHHGVQRRPKHKVLRLFLASRLHRHSTSFVSCSFRMALTSSDILVS